MSGASNSGSKGSKQSSHVGEKRKLPPGLKLPSAYAPTRANATEVIEPAYKLEAKWIYVPGSYHVEGKKKEPIITGAHGVVPNLRPSPVFRRKNEYTMELEIIDTFRFRVVWTGLTWKGNGKGVLMTKKSAFKHTPTTTKEQNDLVTLFQNPDSVIFDGPTHMTLTMDKVQITVMKNAQVFVKAN